MIPDFKPEPEEQLMARFPKALERTYELSVMTGPKTEWPGTKPEHRFDFEDGVRMIVSAEQHEQRVVHLSFGLHVARQADWVALGPLAFRGRGDTLVRQLQDRKLIPPGAALKRIVTDRAIHYWFNL